MPKKSVWLLDVDKKDADDLQILLQDSGYEVSSISLTVKDGGTGAEDKCPDLVIVDIRGRGDMRGLEAGERIQARCDIPMVYLAGDSEITALSRRKVSAPLSYVKKPFTGQELQAVMEVARLHHNAWQELRKKAALNELLMDSLPYPAMLVSQQRKILAANRIAKQLGIKYDVPCWSLFNANRVNSEVSSLSDQPEERSGCSARWEGFCPFCRADEAIATNRTISSLGVKRIGKFWDIWWVPLEDNIFLHYMVDVTQYKQAQEELKRAREDLEERVRARTRDLSKVNDQLQKEIDIRIQGERKLQQSEKMLQSVFDGITDPLMILGSDMSLWLSNKATKKYYQLSDSENFDGTACYRYAKGQRTPCRECRVPSVMTSVMKENLPETFERQGIMEPERIEQVTVYPGPAVEDGVGSVIVRVCDVTEAKNLQANLIQNEKLAALGLLISGIAHEINNPNNFITFNVPIMRDYIDALLPIVDEYAERQYDFTLFGMSYPQFREDIYKLIGNVEHGASRINSTISGLREFARIDDPMGISTTHLAPIVQKAIRLCREQINRMVKQLVVDIPEDLPPFPINPKSLEQVLINLLVNAAHAADKSDSWIKVRILPLNTAIGHYVLDVSDNGCGMDDVVKAKLFEPFFTTKESKDGTGLGMYVSRILIEGMGGRIEVLSELGEGTTFQIILPYPGQ